MKNSRGVIFDLDGTLVDSFPGIRSSIIYAIRKQGHVIGDDIEMRSLIGPPMKVIFQKLLGFFDDDRVNSTIEIYRKHYNKIGLYNSSAYELIREALVTLRTTGYDLYIATSKRQIFAEKLLKTVNLYEFFSVVQGTPADGTLDDKSDLLRSLITSHALNEQKLVLVGDRQDDVKAAHANNILAIGVLWGYGSKQELDDALVDAVCDVPYFLPEAIEHVFSRRRMSC